jgi:cytochrome c biogenesis factor
MFLPLFLLLIFDLSSPFLITMILMPAALKNDDEERGLLLKALIIYSLLIGIISCQNIVSKSMLLLMPILDILLVTILISQIIYR